MAKGRLLAVGDIHGCANTVKALIDKVKPTEDDQLIFLGDYVDRGNRVVETVEFMIDLKKRLPKTIFIKGNHEDLFIRFMSDDAELDKGMFLYNGGRATLADYYRITDKTPPIDEDSYEFDFMELPEEHQKFYDELKVMHIEGDYIFVHAGLRHNVALEDQRAEDLMWLRETFMYNPINTWGGKTIVHGHTPMTVPDAIRYHEKYPDRYDLDTGAVFGYDLSCLDLYSKVTWKQKLIDVRIS